MPRRGPARKPAGRPAEIPTVQIALGLESFRGLRIKLNVERDCRAPPSELVCRILGFGQADARVILAYQQARREEEQVVCVSVWIAFHFE